MSSLDVIAPARAAELRKQAKEMAAAARNHGTAPGEDQLSKDIAHRIAKPIPVHF
jgi:hypothetical protein